MICEQCGGSLYVTDVVKMKYEVIRRRKCKDCGSSYYTSESLIDTATGRMIFQKKRQRYLERKREHEAHACRTN